MKKLISLLFLGFFLAFPTVTNAAWWQPKTWFNNWTFTPKIDVKTQELNNRINELEKTLKNTSVAPVAESLTASQVDNSAAIKAQTKVTSKAKDSDALVVKQTVDELARAASIKTEEDRLIELKALKDAETVKKQAQREQDVINAKIADKQKKLDAINLQIANLNAKYAKDSAAVKSAPGISTIEQRNAELNDIYSKYTDIYNALMAEYQQIKYSN